MFPILIWIRIKILKSRIRIRIQEKIVWTWIQATWIRIRVDQIRIRIQDARIRISLVQSCFFSIIVMLCDMEEKRAMCSSSELLGLAN